MVEEDSLSGGESGESGGGVAKEVLRCVELEDGPVVEDEDLRREKESKC